jgi:thiosulfate/3-mercaptopyruvate sulfurtransferase
MYTTIVSTQTLSENLSNPNWVIVDTRFDLMNAQWGKQAYAAAHIPGAHFMDLNDDLASKPGSRGGRHPLPDLELFTKKLGAMGITAGTQVVVYDQGSMMFVGRLWWMLREWLGHASVAVLDGGYAAWEKELRTVSSAEPAAQKGHFSPQIPKTFSVAAESVLAGLAQSAHCLIDARAPERYRGEVEPIDAMAGHIPGALNRPFAKNLGADGKLLSAAQLRTEFESLLAGRAPQEVVHSCGSGVSACANLLAMEVAGLSGSKLYPGSWSDWSSDPSRPVAKG